MSTIKEDVKDVGLSLVYDFLLVALIFSWIFAIIFALIEVSLWIVFGFFLLGCGFLSGVMYFQRKSEEEEKAELAAKALEEAESTEKLSEVQEEQKETTTEVS